jgi:hypothetical protein
MPSLSSTRNRNVSSAWYIIAAFCLGFGFLVWHAAVAISEIDLTNRAAMAQINDLMTVSHQIHR